MCLRLVVLKMTMGNGFCVQHLIQKVVHIVILNKSTNLMFTNILMSFNIVSVNMVSFIVKQCDVNFSNVVYFIVI